MSLTEQLREGFGKHQFYTDEEKKLYGETNSFNCCEKIFRCSNLVYSLGLDKNAEHVSAAFGGGMGIQTVCGAVTGALMAISAATCDSCQTNCNTKDYSVPFLKKVEEKLGSIYCSELKPKYFVDTDDLVRCDPVILAVAQLLEETMAQIDADKKV